MRWLSAQLAHQQRRLVYTSAKLTAPPSSPAAANLDVLNRSSAAFAEKAFSEVPGPKPLPILGNFMRLLGRHNEAHKVFSDLRDEFGNICKLQFPGYPPMVLLSNAEAVEAMFRNESRYPARMDASGYAWYFKRTKLPQGFLLT